MSFKDRILNEDGTVSPKVLPVALGAMGFTADILNDAYADEIPEEDMDNNDTKLKPKYVQEESSSLLNRIKNPEEFILTENLYRKLGNATLVAGGLGIGAMAGHHYQDDVGELGNTVGKAAASGIHDFQFNNMDPEMQKRMQDDPMYNFAKFMDKENAGKVVQEKFTKAAPYAGAAIGGLIANRLNKIGKKD